MAMLEESIDVNVPVSAAYMQWKQFEEYPHFMEQVEDIRTLDSTHYHWRAKYGGKAEEWDAEIVEDIPDQRVAWRSISGNRNDGVVAFEPVSPGVTRIHLKLAYEPSSVTEKVGSALGLDKRMVKKNLDDFKRYMEKNESLH